jgi:glycerophosphoryl diester phosphodiesterase
MITPAGLAEVATYATAIGPHKLQVIPLEADGTLDEPSALLQNAHAAGLKVHAYTFRAENQFLPEDLRSDAEPHHLGDLQSELSVYLRAGLDGFFTDHADYGARARDALI